MFRPLILFLLCRYLFGLQSSRFCLRVSWLAVLGITVAVMVLIVVLAIMNGFSAELHERTMSTLAHGSLHYRQPRAAYQADLEQLQQRPELSQVAKITTFSGMLSLDHRLLGAKMVGVDPSRYRPALVDHFLPPAAGRSWQQLLSPKAYQLIMGVELARQLGVTVGDHLLVTVPQLTFSPVGGRPRSKRFQVAALFQVGAEADSLMVYGHWQDFATLLRHPQQVTALELTFKDPLTAPRWLPEIAAELSVAVDHESWFDTHGSLFQAVATEKRVVSLLLLLIIAVAAFNLFSGQLMMVAEKRGDIAILTTLGFTVPQVVKLFFCKSLIIGFLGLLLGLVLGLFIVAELTTLITWLDQTFAWQLFAGFYMDYLPTRLIWSETLLVLLLAMLFITIASIIPARRAAAMEPLTILQKEQR